MFLGALAPGAKALARLGETRSLTALSLVLNTNSCRRDARGIYAALGTLN